MIPTPDLEIELFRLLRQIPRGQVATYGDLARALGDIRAARWVGGALLNHDHSSKCRCHRVVRSSGEVGLFIEGDSRLKEQRLVEEGVSVSEGKVNLSRRMSADDFQSDSPLTTLIQHQAKIRRQANEAPLSHQPDLLVGLDVAYPSSQIARAAAVVIDAETLETVDEQQLELPVRFPYIPGYLTYRELPALLAVWETIQPRLAGNEVCFIDGNGRLHPRRTGVAVSFGVLANRPTIGIGKSLLCGKVDLSEFPASDSRLIIDQEEVIGAAVKTTDQSRPVFVSVGHRITLEQATCISRACMTDHRTPEPIYLADRLSKRAVASGGTES